MGPAPVSSPAALPGRLSPPHTAPDASEAPFSLAGAGPGVSSEELSLASPPTLCMWGFEQPPLALGVCPLTAAVLGRCEPGGVWKDEHGGCCARAEELRQPHALETSKQVRGRGGE